MPHVIAHSTSVQQTLSPFAVVWQGSSCIPNKLPRLLPLLPLAPSARMPRQAEARQLSTPAPPRAQRMWRLTVAPGAAAAR